MTVVPEEGKIVILFPVIDRELRVWARNSGTYWGRFVVALSGMAVCAPQFGTFSWLGSGPSTTGKYVFNGLVAAAFLLSCCACFLTSDAISAERRAGTLPLLLLTPLKPFDVVLGKLSSSGLACLCSIIALLPVLMLPVLTGGVTGGEVFRKGLVCFNTLFFSLAVGLYQSVLSKEKFKAGVLAGLMLAGFIFLPFGTELFRISGMPSFSFLSPMYGIISADDALFRAQPLRFSASVVSVQVFAWVLLQRAAVRLRNIDREEPTVGSISSPIIPPPWESVHRKISWNGDASPVSWLFHRQRGIRVTFWVAAAFTIFYQSGWFLFGRGAIFGSPLNWVMLQSPAFSCSLIAGALFAWAASRFSFESHRNGELELLLTTPAGVQTFVADQWAALKRSLVGPLIVMLLPILFGSFGRTVFLPVYSLFAVLGAINMVLSSIALCWCGMWFGFTAQRQGRAILLTVLLVKGVPFLLSTLMMLLYPVLLSLGSRSTFQFASLLMQAVVLLFYVRIIQGAKQRLNGQLSHTGPKNFTLMQFLAGDVT